MELVYYKTKSRFRSEKYAWRLLAANGRELCRSSEGYTKKEDARVSAILTIGANRPDIKSQETW